MLARLDNRPSFGIHTTRGPRRSEMTMWPRTRLWRTLALMLGFSLTIIVCPVVQAEPTKPSNALLEQLGILFGKNDGGRLVVAEVRDNSPAARADLRTGDVLLLAEENVIRSPNDFSEIFQQGPEVIHLTITRNREIATLRLYIPRELRTAIVSKPGEEALLLGMTIAKVGKFATVTKVTPTSPAWESGIRERDVILKIEMFEPEDFESLLAGTRKYVADPERKRLSITLQRNGEEFVVGVHLTDEPETDRREQVRVSKPEQQTNVQINQPSSQNRFLFDRGSSGFAAFQERASRGAVAVLYRTGAASRLQNSNSPAQNGNTSAPSTQQQQPGNLNQPQTGQGNADSPISALSPAFPSDNNQATATIQGAGGGIQSSNNIIGRVSFQSDLNGTTVNTMVSGLQPGRYVVGLYQQFDQLNAGHVPAAGSPQQQANGNSENATPAFNSPGQQSSGQPGASQAGPLNQQPNTQVQGSQQPLMILGNLLVNYQGYGQASEVLANIPVMNLVGLTVTVHPISAQGMNNGANPNGTTSPATNQPVGNPAQGNPAQGNPAQGNPAQGNVGQNDPAIGQQLNGGNMNGMLTQSPPVAVGVIGFSGISSTSVVRQGGQQGTAIPPGVGVNPAQTQ